MKKAFLFDMDGVMADSETAWDQLGYDDLLKSYFGLELFGKVKVNSGTSIKGIFDAFVVAGWQGDYAPFHKENEKIAKQIYDTIPLSLGLDELIQELDKRGFTIAVVSSSPTEWVESVINRLPSRQLITKIVSVNNHKTLKPKPSPDPYIFAMEELCVISEQTIVLEDSETGVTAAKASGAKVICLTMYQHGYDWQVLPKDGDFYAKTMTEVLDVVAKIDLQ
jgi:HAD superfamily hydrolase (TIGR01509 family)